MVPTQWARGSWQVGNVLGWGLGWSQGSAEGERVSLQAPGCPSRGLLNQKSARTRCFKGLLSSWQGKTGQAQALGPHL